MTSRPSDTSHERLPKAQGLQGLGNSELRIFTYFSSILGELKVNLWDHIGIIVPPKRLKVTYSTTKFTSIPHQAPESTHALEQQPHEVWRRCRLVTDSARRPNIRTQPNAARHRPPPITGHTVQLPVHPRTSRHQTTRNAGTEAEVHLFILITPLQGL